MHIRLVNRIWSIYLPFSLLLLYYTIRRLEYPFDKFYEIDLYLVLISVFLISAVVQTTFFLKRIRRRKAHLDNVKPVSSDLIEKHSYPERLSFLNVKLVINHNSMDVFDKLSFKLFAKKDEKTIEVKSNYTNQKHSFNDIDSILFEFDNISYYTLRSDWDKTIWVGSFSIVLKSKKIVHLFNLRSERDHLKELGEYKDIDTNEYYYKIGLKILNILTNELNMKYSILDYTHKPGIVLQK